jgi:hypothetical protein
MRSRQAAEEWQRLQPAQRLRLVLQMIREAMPALLQGKPELVGRRFELLRRQNDERNRRMLEGIARTRKRP